MSLTANSQNNEEENHPEEPLPAAPDELDEGNAESEPPEAPPDVIIKMMTEEDLKKLAMRPSEGEEEKKS